MGSAFENWQAAPVDRIQQLTASLGFREIGSWEALAALCERSWKHWETYRKGVTKASSTLADYGHGGGSYRQPRRAGHLLDARGRGAWAVARAPGYILPTFSVEGQAFEAAQGRAGWRLSIEILALKMEGGCKKWCEGSHN
jgi:hypothetical protein